MSARWTSLVVAALAVALGAGGITAASFASGALALPSVTSVVPDAGPTTGRNTVTINGTSFTTGAQVDFGTTESATVSFVSATELKAVVPAHPAGTVNVTVTTAAGASSSSTKSLYAYGSPTVSSFSPSSGITGSAVTVSGTGFVRGAVVKF